LQQESGIHILPATLLPLLILFRQVAPFQVYRTILFYTGQQGQIFLTEWVLRAIQAL
jgi:hypothetical protein